MLKDRLVSVTQVVYALFSETGAQCADVSSTPPPGFFNGLLLLVRVAIAAQFLPVFRDTFALEIIEVLHTRETVLGWFALWYLLLQFASWLIIAKINENKVARVFCHIQLWFDVVLAVMVLYAKADARTTAVALFMIPLFATSHLGPALLWFIHTIVIVLIAGIVMTHVGTPDRPIGVILATRLAGLLFGTIVLRSYRCPFRKHV